ncbi:MAG: VWA domain-containing protein [Isosphaeraceae bacterium]|nr:VWA domain-containing protein [Isosphaeraceae bacterium]
MHVPVLFAFGFANATMLSALAAASIPIILHLLNKRKFREERWAAMRFLLAAIRKNQRRIRLEQLLLLAIRTLIIILVVCAMAKPFLESIGALPVLAGQRTHRVLVLDGSLSMGYTPAATSRFEQAKELAEKLVKDARQGDAVSVVLMADPPRVVIGAPSPNHAEVIKEIGEIALPHGGTDLTASFQAVDRVLEASTIPQKEVVFLTDLQAASWRKGGGADEGLKRALAKLEARRARSVVIDLGASAGENRAITDLKLDRPVVTPGMNPSPLITATVKNYGPGAADALRVRLMIDGQVGPEQPVGSLAVGEERSLVFPYDFGAPGEHLVEAVIDDDPLKLDNHRWLSVPVREAVNVLLVDGDPKTEAFRSETDFLAAALNPETDSPGTVSPIKAEVASESQVARRDLTSYDVIILCNVAQFTGAEVSALESFLKQGGGVVVFGGDQIQAENYNRLLFDGGKGLLPAEIGPTVGDPDRPQGAFYFNALGFKHPIVAEFAGATATVASSLINAKTYRYHKLRLPKDSTAQVALAFGDDPAIVETPRHRGRVILVATSADTGWTSWPLHLSYPPVMEQIVLQAAAGRQATRNVRVGQPIEQALPATGAEAVALIHRPDGRTASKKIQAAGDVSRLFYEDTDLSGAYRIRASSPSSFDATFAANPDPAESDPAKLDRPALAEALPGWRFDYRSDLNTLFKDATSISVHGEMHRPLLWSVLVLLLVESVLAWRFGHHR